MGCVLASNGLKMNLDILLRNHMNVSGEIDESEAPVLQTLQKPLSGHRVQELSDVIW